MNVLAAPFSLIIDQHIAWLSAWHRLLLYPETSRNEQAEMLMPSVAANAFSQNHLFETPLLVQQQPAFEKIAQFVDQLHIVARLVLTSTVPGALPEAAQYDAVISKHNEVLHALRRVERAFGVADAALDPLTGLRNRHGMREDLSREYNRFIRTGGSFCVALMDIDHFKKINDTHGHDAGDTVLKIVASHITRTLRIYDDVYRMGGEEFLVCLKETGMDQAASVLERLRTDLARIIIPLDSGAIINVTASFGLAQVSMDMKIEQTIAHADAALYKAKSAGRNCVIRAS